MSLARRIARLNAAATLALATTATTTMTTTARADEPSGADRPAAELLFDEGRKLLDEGKLDEACAKLEASHRMEPAVGTLLNLGDCNERRARVATAWSNYRAAASLAETRGDAGRADFARRRAKSLEPRLSRMTVRVLSPEPGLVVKRDGVTIDDAVLGTPLPVDAGSHVLEATARGKQAWSKKVVLPTEPTSIVVDVPPLDAAPVAPPPKREELPASEADGTAMRTLGIGVGAAGLAAVGVGTFFGFRAKSQWNDAKPHCLDTLCDDTGFSGNRDARTSGDVATVAFVTGAVLLAAGVTLYLLAPSGPRASRPSSPPAPRARPGVSARTPRAEAP